MRGIILQDIIGARPQNMGQERKKLKVEGKKGGREERLVEVP